MSAMRLDGGDLVVTIPGTPASFATGKSLTIRVGDEAYQGLVSAAEFDGRRFQDRNGDWWPGMWRLTLTWQQAAMEVTELSTIDRLRDLEQSATPGPWRRSGTALNPHWYVYSPGCAVHGPAMMRQPDTVQQTVDRWVTDAALIAESRNALPALLDVAEAARGARATLAGLSAISEVAAILDALDRLEADEE